MGVFNTVCRHWNIHITQNKLNHTNAHIFLRPVKQTFGWWIKISMSRDELTLAATSV